MTQIRYFNSNQCIKHYYINKILNIILTIILTMVFFKYYAKLDIHIKKNEMFVISTIREQVYLQFTRVWSGNINQRQNKKQARQNVKNSNIYIPMCLSQ